MPRGACPSQSRVAAPGRRVAGSPGHGSPGHRALGRHVALLLQLRRVLSVGDAAPRPGGAGLTVVPCTRGRVSARFVLSRRMSRTCRGHAALQTKTNKKDKTSKKRGTKSEA